MNEEIEETEFYQQDFTTASEWEIFISRIEEIINQWRVDDLKETQNKECIWITKSEKLMFADVEFEFLYYEKVKKTEPPCEDTSNRKERFKIENSIDLRHEFHLFDESLCHSHSLIYTWYGVEKYFVLTTTGNIEINSESKIKVLLSSLVIAVSNLNCHIPAFVQIREKWQRLYLGVHQNERFRTNFSMVHLKRIPLNCRYLSDLIQMFLQKVKISHVTNTVCCGTQFTYDLTDFGSSVWKQDIFSLDNDNLDVKSLYRLPFGVAVDPIATLKLKGSWLKQPSTAIGEYQFRSVFEGDRAKNWSILVEDAEPPVCLLSDCLNDYVNSLKNNSTIQDILAELSFDSLVETKSSTISSILGRAARNSLSGAQKLTSTIPENVLVAILYYLFPDADTRESEPSYPYDKKGENNLDESKKFLNVNKECKGFKTCPSDSLLWRFCIISAGLLNSSGFRAFAQIWNEFIQEMRYRWEMNIFIPGLSRDNPDLRTCLLHQKLQMLNCCIERKKSREDSQKELDFDSAEGSSSDEEFFDCAEKPVEEVKKMQPVGRLGKYEGLKLIETGEFLYIPITQEPVPKTEDQLDEDADVLLKLGSDAQGSEMRAKLMSASLLSDMEAFKAANPGAILEDFVRWYSPRDWTEADEEDQWGQKKGELSKRMLIEDNIWAQTWKTAKPVPANKQKLLFLDTTEAEKVMHFLESRTLQQVIELLIPIMLQVAVYRLAEEILPFEVELPDGLERLRNVIKLAERMTRESNISPRKIEGIAQEMAQLELDISKIHSLSYKLNPTGADSKETRELLRDLVKRKEVPVEKKSAIGERLTKLFYEAQQRANLVKEELPEEEATPFSTDRYPHPSMREFVLCVNTRKPEFYSSYCPQYLRAIQTNEGMRLAGAFSEDICFF
ncbi:rab3 GTPase-activating protein catalytic subunit [Coccinella septempunctata]|uniref:rab3 GTPase-activating protein catalytic subunit n=1 Tax=Coccinella septempunctata TaxID=41139 RepID=UPI001D06EC9F|nr:rab3 GTPase-activating protein catalytic subunit [Coccinella septempunctata]